MANNTYGAKLQPRMVDLVIKKLQESKETNVHFKDFTSLRKALNSESIFEGRLGLSILKNLKIDTNNLKVIIYEDIDGYGRVVKEKTKKGEKFLYFAPIVNTPEDYNNSIDEKMKKIDELSRSYDIIEGRYIEATNL